MTGLYLSLALSASGTLADADRPRLSRSDLPELRKLDRAAVFAALGSFDEHGLSDEEFAAQKKRLLES